MFMSSWNGTRQFQIFCYHRLKHFSFYLVYKFYNVTEDIKGVVVVPFSLKASGEKGGGIKMGPSLENMQFCLQKDHRWNLP